MKKAESLEVFKADIQKREKGIGLQTFDSRLIYPLTLCVCVCVCVCVSLSVSVSLCVFARVCGIGSLILIRLS